MLYKQPFVLYLNISLCLILLFLALPSLLNRREDVKVRLSFFLIFFVVIATCLINLVVLYTENYKLAFLGFFVFFISLLFGPLIYYYVRNLLGSNVSKGIFISLIPGVASVGYGIYLAFADSNQQKKVFQQMLAREHLFYEATNLLTLILTLIYCVKAWLFIRKFQQEKSYSHQSPSRVKISWAKEFIIYMFANVFVFLLLVLVLTNFFEVTTMDMDLIGMPVFMLFVYLLVAIRSMMMYKEFEHQFVLAKIESEKELQQQRLKISRDLHDSLGAQLTFSNSILDSIRSSATALDEKTASKIDRLSEFSQNSVSELKSVLWVLNTENIHLQDLKARLLNLVKDAREGNEKMRFNFNFETTANSLLSSKQAISLFRVVQEMMNNAIKHSRAGELSICVQQKDDWLYLVISDNGIGFDWEKEKHKSFGLSHITDRIADIEGQIQVDTSANSGTIYKIKIPLEQ